MTKQKMLRLKPAKKDLIVRDPETGRALDAKGEQKPRNSYWVNRLNDEDVIDMDATVKADDKKEATPKKLAKDSNTTAKT